MFTKKNNLHQSRNSELRDETTRKPAHGSPMVSDDEHNQSIQDLAYSLWEQAGKPDGDAARDQFCAKQRWKSLRLTPRMKLSHSEILRCTILRDGFTKSHFKRSHDLLPELEEIAGCV